ncbi:MAG: glycosyltransferase family 4 protein [Chloroflexi bacterium]|nr:glycosyltransferase family 4 protein [Chloroflexota bacterium]
MRLLLVHNYYQQPGGEDVVFASERDLLAKMGHDVHVLTAHNDSVAEIPRSRAFVESIWSRSFQRILDAKIAEVRPDVVHFHNTFMVISPAAFYTVKKWRIPLVQTLHNYRLACPAATFFRDGQICEACLGHFVPLPGIRHGCYRESKVTTATVAAMMTVHRAMRTWSNQVDRFVVLTEFARQKFMETGLPDEKMVVKPNFLVEDPDVGARSGGYALFVGRLSEEKGVRTLVESWSALPHIPLKIVGDGPLMPELRALVESRSLTNVELLGRRSREDTLAFMKDAYCLVFPSEWYEGLPMTIVEAFACGVPVIASNVGAMRELVAEGHTGLFFTAGDTFSLATTLQQAWSQPDAMSRIGQNARQEFLARFTAERNYEQLLAVYQSLTGSGQPIG